MLDKYTILDVHAVWPIYFGKLLCDCIEYDTASWQPVMTGCVRVL